MLLTAAHAAAADGIARPDYVGSAPDDWLWKRSDRGTQTTLASESSPPYST